VAKKILICSCMSPAPLQAPLEAASALLPSGTCLLKIWKAALGYEQEFCWILCCSEPRTSRIHLQFSHLVLFQELSQFFALQKQNLVRQATICDQMIAAGSVKATPRLRQTSFLSFYRTFRAPIAHFGRFQ
jgi:hypothetical protein